MDRIIKDEEKSSPSPEGEMQHSNKIDKMQLLAI
jgi:hypothetical protein